MGERCPWCDATLRPARTRSFHVTRCTTCGVGVTRPRPSDAQLADAYGDAYRPADGKRFGGPGDALLRATRARLARHVDARAPAGAVLDVGAGDGTLLDAVQRTGRRAVGLERDARDPRMLAAEPWELDERFAAVVMWHSLEHLREPARALRAAYELLLPGGLLVVAVPNWGSLQARAFGADWLALDLPRHLVHLPRAALVHRLRALGLVVERVSGWRGGQVTFGWLHGIVKTLPGRPDLYDALRREQARMTAQPAGARRRAVALGVAAAPLALAAAGTEISLHRGGTTHVEARRP